MGEKTFEERRQDMETAISRDRESISTGTARGPLAAAFLEDEAVRLTAQERARQYVIECEAYRNEMPQWMWYLLYFLLGMLFTMTINPLQYFIMDMIKIYNGGL